jgi:hypothetical protein
MMANRLDRRLLSLFMTVARFGKAAYLMRRRRADSIRARALFKGSLKGRIYVSNRFSSTLRNSLAPRLGPYRAW